MAASVVAATTLVGGRTESVDLSPLIGRGALALACVALVASIAQAQAPASPTAPAASDSAGPGGPIPYAPSSTGPVQVRFPTVVGQTWLSDADREGLINGLAAARRGDTAAYDAAV